jgi:pimeloyl-ACP methyl ester carboxylesterase
VDLSVTECGPADAPTLLFVHGGGISRWMWEPQLALLAADFHCLVVDLPGHGDSAGVPFVSIADCAERLHTLIKTRAHKKVASVIGVSLGAQILLELMARFPGRVGKAVLSGTLARPMRGSTWLRLGLYAYAPFRNLPMLVRANMQAQGIPETYSVQWAADTRRLRPGQLAAVMSANMAFGPPQGLEHVAVPTLLLTGDSELEILHRSAHDLAGRMRNARAGTVQGAGHAWNLASPELFADTVRAWMAGKPLPDRIQNLTELPPVEVPDGPIRPPVVEDDDDEWWEEKPWP